MSNKKYTTDGQVITNGESAMGIFSATDYINQLEEKLQEAQERLVWLNCLEAAGVDNWEGIDMAYEIRDGDE